MVVLCDLQELLIIYFVPLAKHHDTDDIHVQQRDVFLRAERLRFFLFESEVVKNLTALV